MTTKPKIIGGKGVRVGGTVAKRVKAIKQSLLVTPRLEEFLTKHPEIPVNARVANMISQQIKSKPRDRRASFSASSIHQCVRRQCFTYIGLPEVTMVDSTIVNLFNDGHWRHRRWQAMLLMAGIIDSIEVPKEDPAWKLRGTLDGTGYLEGVFGWELKGANSVSFRKVVEEGKVKPEHYAQVQTYFMLDPSITRFSVIYENKDTSDWKEFVLRPDPGHQNALRLILALLIEASEKKDLPKMKDECKSGEGEFRQCQYAYMCEGIRDWSHAESFAPSPPPTAPVSVSPPKMRRAVATKKPSRRASDSSE